MATRTVRKALIAAILVAVVPAVGISTVGLTGLAAAPAGAATAAAGGSLQCPGGTGTGSPGVTAKQINVGAISTLSGPISADFASFVPGVQAYFDVVDETGGVNGRKIVAHLRPRRGRTSTQFRLARRTPPSTRTTPSPSSCRRTGSRRPTSVDLHADVRLQRERRLDTGPATSSAVGGSVQTYNTIVPRGRLPLDHTKSKSIAALAYGVSTSSVSARRR